MNHSTGQLENGSKVQLGTGYVTAGYSTNPADPIQPDYFALQSRDSRGIERFAGLNANPGWFFGLYADSFVSPATTDNDSSFAAPWLRFARNGWSSGGALALGDGKFRMGVFEGSASWNRFQPVSEHRGNGAMLEYQLPTRQLSLSLQSGFVNESDTFLGTEFGSALGQMEKSETFFAGINGHLQIRENWQGLFALYSGTTDSGLNSGLLKLDNAIASSAWSLGLSGHSIWQRNDRFTVYLAQPLRIEQGQASLQLASGRTIDRQVIYQTVAIDLQPRGREQQLEMNYQFAWGRANATARAEYIHQPDHNIHNSSYSEVTLSLQMPIGR